MILVPHGSYSSSDSRVSPCSNLETLNGSCVPAHHLKQLLTSCLTGTQESFCSPALHRTSKKCSGTVCYTRIVLGPGLVAVPRLGARGAVAVPASQLGSPSSSLIIQGRSVGRRKPTEGKGRASKGSQPGAHPHPRRRRPRDPHWVGLKPREPRGCLNGKGAKGRRRSFHQGDTRGPTRLGG